MDKKTIDRRSARTRKALHEALIALILRQGYDATTIQDIIDEADVGRSTFYAHYTGKEDLLRGGFERLREDLALAREKAADRAGISPGETLKFSLAMFEHACGYRHVYRALAGGRGGAVAVGEIRRILSELIQKEFSTDLDDGAVSRELAVQFIVGAFLTVLTWALERNPSLSPKDLDAMFRRLALSGIGPSTGAESRP